MKKILFSLMLLFLAPLGLSAQETVKAAEKAAVPAVAQASTGGDFPMPKQTLVGLDTKYAVGDLIVLSVSEPASEVKPTKTSVIWTVEEFDYTKAEMKKRDYQEGANGVFLGTGPKPVKLFVRATVTYLFVGADNSKVGTRTQELVGSLLVGNPPNPGPGPVDPVNPVDPNIPDGLFGLTKFTYGQFNQLVTGTNKVAIAGTLSSAVRSSLAAANAGVIKPTDSTQAAQDKAIASFLTMIKTAQTEGLAKLNVPATTLDQFGTALQKETYKLYQNKTVASFDDTRKAWAAIADALELITK